LASPSAVAALGQRLVGLLGGSTFALTEEKLPELAQDVTAQTVAYGSSALDYSSSGVLAGGSGSGTELSAAARAVIDAEVAAYARRLVQLASFAPPANYALGHRQPAEAPLTVDAEPSVGVASLYTTAGVAPLPLAVFPLRVKLPPRPRPETALPLPPNVPLEKPILPLLHQQSPLHDPASVASMRVAASTFAAAAVATAAAGGVAGLSAAEAAFLGANGSPTSLLFHPSRGPTKGDVLVFVHVPKTAGSVFFDKMKARAKSLRFYPDGQHSFHDRG
jgi:hypothetical protein